MTVKFNVALVVDPTIDNYNSRCNQTYLGKEAETLNEFVMRKEVVTQVQFLTGTLDIGPERKTKSTLCGIGDHRALWTHQGRFPFITLDSDFNNVLNMPVLTFPNNKILATLRRN